MQPTLLRHRANQMLALVADKTADPEEKRMAIEIVVSFNKLARLRERRKIAGTPAKVDQRSPRLAPRGAC
jgi:hypothetical protein